MHLQNLRPFTFSAASVALTAACLLGANIATEGKRWWSHIEYLASDDLRGRNTGSAEHKQAAVYVATQFEKAGLKPAGTDGYLQPVKFNVRRLVEDKSSLELVRDGKAEKLVLGDDAILSIRTDPAAEAEAPLYFAGYGFAVPEMNYNDLADPELRGKIIVTLAGSPGNIPGPLRAHYGSPAERRPFLKQAGVLGVVSIPNPKHMDIPWSRMRLSRGQPAMALQDASLDDGGGLLVGATVNPERAQKLLEGTGHTLEELLALADAGKPLPHFAIPAKLRSRAALERSQVESQNVAGMLPGSDPKLRNEFVVVSAHLDHVGEGNPINGDRIYNGAMDDASGIATILEMAHQLRESKAKPKRSILFVAVTAEEKGLLGSKYFAAHPTVTSQNIVADVNIDMFLPLFPLRSVFVYGLNESDLADDLRKVAGPLNIAIQDDPEPDRNIFVRSDQYSFIRRGVPALTMKVGYQKGSPEEKIAKDWLRERYHAPSDDLKQPVDLEAAATYNRLMLALTESIANRPARPQWRPNSFFKRFATEN